MTLGPQTTPVPKRAQLMEKQAGGSELTLLENICQDGGKQRRRGEREEKQQVSDKVEHDGDDNRS